MLQLVEITDDIRRRRKARSRRDYDDVRSQSNWDRYSEHEYHIDRRTKYY